MQGLTSRSILIALPSGGILEMSRRFLDARRPLEMLPEHREEMLIPYIPELPFATEDFINYNQTAMRVREIRSALVQIFYFFQSIPLTFLDHQDLNQVHLFLYLD